MSSNLVLPSVDVTVSAPWWRFGIVWLVVGLPASIVVAGFAMVAVAVRGADTHVPLAGIDAAAAPRVVARPTSPALQARNHAATPAE
jgi:hypothetical protein